MRAGAKREAFCSKNKVNAVEAAILSRWCKKTGAFQKNDGNASSSKDNAGAAGEKKSEAAVTGRCSFLLPDVRQERRDLQKVCLRVRPVLPGAPLRERRRGNG